MKTNPFSLLIDRSSDTGLERLNPLTVRIFDKRSSQILTHLLNKCTTSGRKCGTAVAIFSKIGISTIFLDVIALGWVLITPVSTLAYAIQS